MNLFDAIQIEANTTTTDNGAPAYKSTNDACLDFFAKASRSNPAETARLFRIAYAADPETALRTLFYFRDIRGGQGEKKFTHECFKELVGHKNIKSIIQLIPTYGCWKDLLTFYNTKAWTYALEVIAEALEFDLNALKVDGKSVSLLGKWLPSENAGKAAKPIANSIREYLGYTPRKYRTTLTALRNRISIVENKMCSNEWGNITYEYVPSKASLMYRKAFKKHDFVRYSNYLSQVASGKTKINSATLYPSDIVSKAFRDADKTALDALWKALPNYIDSPYNGIVIADTSGSMQSPEVGGVRPIDVAIGVATYVAERNPSEVWKNKFIVFSKNPELLTLVGDNICDYVRNYPEIVSDNTDLIKVAELIVTAGKNNNLTDDDMPKVITIVSDMQFDNFNKITRDYKNSRFKSAHDKFTHTFTSAGYTAPNVVYWDVNNNANCPITKDNYGTCMVTGFSPVIMKTIIAAKSISPIEIMMSTVYNSRYDAVGSLAIGN